MPPGTLGRITIHPGRTMKVIATVTGPLKKYVGKEVLVSQITGVRDYPVEPQISKICENECIGFNVTNQSSETLVIEKAGQGVACLSLWAVVKSDHPNLLINWTAKRAVTKTPCAPSTPKTVFWDIWLVEAQYVWETSLFSSMVPTSTNWHWWLSAFSHLLSFRCDASTFPSMWALPNSAWICF